MNMQEIFCIIMHFCVHIFILFSFVLILLGFYDRITVYNLY